MTPRGARRSSAIAALCAVAALVATACGPATASDSAPSASPFVLRTVPPASSSASAGPRTTANPMIFDALLGDHFFDPQVIVIKVGMTVTWRNSSGSHNVTAVDGSFLSGPLGTRFSQVFDQPGRYPFFCTFHPAEMRGEVVVNR